MMVLKDLENSRSERKFNMFKMQTSNFKSGHMEVLSSRISVGNGWVENKQFFPFLLWSLAQNRKEEWGVGV